jgi:hypothetical protein
MGGPCRRRIPDLHRGSRQQVVNGLIASRGRQNDEGIPAQQALDHETCAGLEEADIAAARVIDHPQVGDIVPERAAGERHQDRLIKQRRRNDRESQNA